MVEGSLMDQDEPVLEQLNLSNFNMLSSLVLRAFNNYSIIMSNNTNNIRIP